MTRMSQLFSFNNLVKTKNLISIVNNQNQLIIAIMGGDGSLGTIIKELRKSEAIEKNINKFNFCALPFGTGNDTG